MLQLCAARLSSLLTGRNNFPAFRGKFTLRCPGRQVRHGSYPMRRLHAVRRIIHENSPGLPAGRKEALFPPLPGREQGTMPFSPSALGNITFCAQPSIPAFPFHPILLQFIQGEVDTEQIHDEYIKTRDQQKAHLYPHADDDHCTVGVSMSALRNRRRSSAKCGPEWKPGKPSEWASGSEGRSPEGLPSGLCRAAFPDWQIPRSGWHFGRPLRQHPQAKLCIGCHLQAQPRDGVRRELRHRKPA